MKKVLKLIALLSLIAITASGAACSKLLGPSNEDAIKAISDSGLLKSEGFSLAAPIEIVEKGGKSPDGSWPVRVKLTLNAKMLDGQTKQLVTTPTFRIYKSKDSSGKTVWAARLGG